MSQRLLFAETRGAEDALLFASRASVLADDVVRIEAAGGVLALTAAPLSSRGLLDSTPTVLGLRSLRADPALVCDIVVTASALSAAADDNHAVVLPETGVNAAWAGISPPRGNWEQTGEIPASTLATRAEWGIAAVANAVPTDAGEEAVRAVRGQVWGESDEALGGLVRGVAFTAFALGFIRGAETARVFRSERWVRVALERGNVLHRGPVRSGLTEVRRTGE